MKKIIIAILLCAAVTVSASAQRKYVPYVGAGVSGQILSSFTNVGGDFSVGFRNYNRRAFVSFGAGAEAMAYIVPNFDESGTAFGIYAIPELGLAIGPSGFKLYPHSGLMMGYASNSGKFGLGIKDGLALDFGRHFTLDFSGYYTFNDIWTLALNFIWRF